MPLQEGSSKVTISKNIEHCMRNWKQTGKVNGKKVGNSKAMEMCTAMSYASARKSSKGSALEGLLKDGKK